MQFFGRIDWAEQVFGGAGTHTFYKLVGLFFIVIALLHLFGALGPLFSPLGRIFGGI